MILISHFYELLIISTSHVAQWPNIQGLVNTVKIQFSFTSCCWESRAKFKNSFSKKCLFLNLRKRKQEQTLVSNDMELWVVQAYANS